MQWILGGTKEPLFLSDTAPEPESLREEEVRYGGYLWPDIDGLEEVVRRFHPRLLQDFRSGWTAVGFTLKAPPRRLGPWAAPTSARPHPAAPLGLYLLSADRLRESLAQSADPLTIHLFQPQLGTFFCDPALEVSLSYHRDFHYRPPSPLRTGWGALRYLIRGGSR